MKDKPIHICIGSPRSGTTWLFNNLKTSEEIFLPAIKEVRFWFGARAPHEVKDTVNFHASEELPLFQRQWIEKWAKEKEISARSYYDLMTSELPASLDISPSYSVMPEDKIQELFYALPKSSKVFLLVRNPLDRALSELKLHAYMHGYFRGEAENQTILDFAQEPEQFDRNQYIDIIERWSGVFGERFKVFYYDDLETSPSKHLRNICDFLNIYKDKEIPLEKTDSFFGSDKGTGHKSIYPSFNEFIKSEIAKLYRQSALDFSCIDPKISQKWVKNIDSKIIESAAPSHQENREYWPNFSRLLRMSESLGDNCEFGFFQSSHNYSPSSLFRWAVTPIDNLLNYLSSPFELFQRENLEIKPDSDLVFDSGSGFYFHSNLIVKDLDGDNIFVSEDEFDAIYKREKEKIDYLTYKFQHQIRTKPCLYVIKKNDGIELDKASSLLMQLRKYNSNHALLVVCSDNQRTGHYSLVSDGLYQGFIDRFAGYSEADNISKDGWNQLFSKLTKDSHLSEMIKRMFV